MSSLRLYQECTVQACVLYKLSLVVAGMETATSAAAAGGITTVIDMPLNSDPTTTTVELLQKKISATRVSHQSRGFVNCLLTRCQNSWQHVCRGRVPRKYKKVLMSS